jgi:hypothetical protein
MDGLSIARLTGAACAALFLTGFTSGSGAGAGKIATPAGEINPDLQGQPLKAAEPPDPCVTGGHTVMMRKAGGEQEKTHEQARTGRDCASRTLRPGTHMLNPQPLPPG